MKRFFALLISAALLLSGCAASENSVVTSENNVSQSADNADNSESASDSSSVSSDGVTSSAAVNSEDNSSDGAEAPAESDTGTQTESKPDSTGDTDSSRAPEESSQPASQDGAATESVPPAPESTSSSTEKPEESAADAPSPETTPAENPAEASNESAEGFYVSGTKLYDANGNEFVMRGINHPHSWFKDRDETALAAIAKTGANCVRIVCGDGQQYTKDSAEDLLKLVERCKALEMIAILEVHDITGKDDPAALEKTVDYWIEVKDALIGNEAYVMLNIANEWIGQWESDTWTKGYTAAIPRLREAGIRNTIIVDAAGWGQYAKSIADGGTEVFESDPLKNTMFSIHMYGSAGKNERVIKQNLARVTQKGLCVIVGEFGYTHSDGDVDEAYIMRYCGENDIGYLGWSWKGNGGGVEYLDIALEWDGSRLSEDWGVNLIEGDTGIRKTSEKCSVFK